MVCEKSFSSFGEAKKFILNQESGWGGEELGGEILLVESIGLWGLGTQKCVL